MANEFTDGYDAKAAVAESFLSELFQHVTPAAQSRTITWDGADHLLEVHFHHLLPKAPILGTLAPVGYLSEHDNAVPHLRLLPPNGDESLVELHFPFRAMVRSLGIEKAGEARVTIPAQPVLTENETLGTTTARVDVDLSALGPNQFDFHLELGTISWRDTSFLAWKALAHFPQVLFEQEVEPLIVESIRAIDRVALTPKTNTLQVFNFKPYISALDQLHKATGLSERFLGLFARKQLVGVPPLPNLFSSQPFPDASSSTNMFTYLPAEVVQPILDEKAADAAADAPIEIDNFKVELAGFFVLASGHAEGADFNVLLQLSILSSGDLHAEVVSIDVDLPWYLDILDAFIFGVIEDAAKEAIADAIGPTSAAAFSGISVLTDDLEQPAGPLVLVNAQIENVGDITVRPGGIILPGQAKVAADLSAIARPERAFAHRTSKEFHRATCPHHFDLASQNLVIFPNPGAAIRQSFNGCAYCYSEYNINDLDYGYLDLRLRVDGGSSAPQDTSVTLRRSQEITLQEVSLEPFIRLTPTNWKEKSPPNWTTKAPLDLFAGTWSVEVSRGSWSIECEVPIPRRRHRKFARLEVEVGTARCATSEHAIPASAPLSIGKLRI